MVAVLQALLATSSCGQAAMLQTKSRHLAPFYAIPANAATQTRRLRNGAAARRLTTAPTDPDCDTNLL